MMSNAFYFILKALFVLKMFAFLFWLFGYAWKRLNKKAKENYKTYDVTCCNTNIFDKHIAGYLKK